MKVLKSELAINRTELEAKEETSKTAATYISNNMVRIKGIKSTITVTHSWGKHKLYADPRYAYTVLVPAEQKVALASLVQFYKTVNKLFKDCGKPNLFWHRKGMLLAIGFNMDKQRMLRLQELFG